MEGNNLNNNWYEWERATRTDGKPACKDIAGDACDHWNLFDKDVQVPTRSRTVRRAGGTRWAVTAVVGSGSYPFNCEYLRSVDVCECL